MSRAELSYGQSVSDVFQGTPTAISLLRSDFHLLRVNCSLAEFVEMREFAFRSKPEGLEKSVGVIWECSRGQNGSVASISPDRYCTTPGV